jgi:hypothetical protein
LSENLLARADLRSSTLQPASGTRMSGVCSKGITDLASMKLSSMLQRGFDLQGDSHVMLAAGPGTFCAFLVTDSERKDHRIIFSTSTPQLAFGTKLYFTPFFRGFVQALPF